MAKQLNGNPVIFNDRVYKGEKDITLTTRHSNTGFKFEQFITAPYIIMGAFKIIEEDDKLKFKKYNIDTKIYDTKFSIEN